ncbi:hypothetical protein BT69DRAFT_35488 [Atractiella rhizophila]|nr:hypothetical protein BT69DRAFT_35488 [Atractiella rhizophila]
MFFSLLFVLFSLLPLSLSATHSRRSSAKHSLSIRHTNNHAKRGLSQSVYPSGGYPYVYNIPSGETKYSSKAPYPIIVFLHGYGSRSPSGGTETATWDGNGLIIAQGGNDKPHVQARESFITVLPVLPTSEQTWNHEKVWKSYQHFISNHADIVDTTRQYVNGYSLGSMGTFSMLLHYPDTFAAAIASSDPPSDYYNGDKDYKTVASSGVALWGFGGEFDKPGRASGTLEAVTKIKDMGGYANYTVDKGADHGIQSYMPWTVDDGAVFDFMLAHSKGEKAEVESAPVSDEPTSTKSTTPKATQEPTFTEASEPKTTSKTRAASASETTTKTKSKKPKHSSTSTSKRPHQTKKANPKTASSSSTVIEETKTDEVALGPQETATTSSSGSGSVGQQGTLAQSQSQSEDENSAASGLRTPGFVTLFLAGALALML